MEYRRLGTSDLRVSEIAYGAWLTTYGDGGFERARACVDRAFEVGINFIDTANLYGLGASESALGEILTGRPRDSYVLATKVYFPMGPDDRGLSRAQIEKQLDASLKRLRTDHLDLYQCHRYDEETPLEETLEALSAAVRAGKVRYIGFSEWTPAQIRAAAELPGVERFVSSQPQYSLLWRQPENGVIPLCRELGNSQIVFSPLAQGVLSGKYQPGAAPPADSRAASPEMGKFMGRWLADDIVATAAELKGLAEAAGVSLAQFALAWVLREPNVAAAIAGASRPEQVDQNAAASGLKVDPLLFARAEAIAARVAFDAEALRAEERARFAKARS
ncbi:MAG: aldo/keto reductase [Phenylobacterium sp.]|nr:aldo/keto reductase [Phenylobacterium sp.]